MNHPGFALVLASSCALIACGQPSGDQSSGGDTHPDGGGQHPFGGTIDGGTSPRDGGKDAGGGKNNKDAGRGNDSGNGGDDGSVNPIDAGVLDCLPEQTDNVAASINPPAGLDASRVPMFVMFGFDDNYHSDGMNWVVNTLFGGKRNADGSPARATFFIVGGGGTSQNGGVFVDANGTQTEQDVIDSWKNAYDAGHEIGNHTWDHADGGDARSLADWQTEIGKSNDFLVNQVGIPQCEIVGWRFPYLHFDDDGFQAIQPAGLRYDTSIEFGYDWWQPPGMSSGFGNTSPEYGKHYWWPFTLDNGLDSSFACCKKGVQAHPGMWEFPVHTFTRPDPADNTKVKTTTGLDYNLWTTIASVDPTADFCGTLKYSFDQRYKSNRSPFNAGMHSDIYSMHNSDDDTAFHNTGDVRRAALQCFVDYVLTFPDARIVTFKQVVEWMRNPQPIH